MKPVEINAEISKLEKLISDKNVQRRQALQEELSLIHAVIMFTLENGEKQKDCLHQVMRYKSDRFDIMVLDHGYGYNTITQAYTGNYFLVIKYNLQRVLNIRIDYERGDSIRLSDKLANIDEIITSADSYAYILPGSWQAELQAIITEAEFKSAAAKLISLQHELAMLETIVP